MSGYHIAREDIQAALYFAADMETDDDDAAIEEAIRDMESSLSVIHTTNFPHVVR